jgi:hypothetical protein
MGLSDEALAALFAAKMQMRDQPLALCVAPDREASAQPSRAAGCDLSQQDWPRYRIAQLRAWRLKLVCWE